MLEKIKTLRKIVSLPYLAELIAILAIVWYVVQSIGYVHTLPVIEDEGQYLIKGLYFLMGEYKPFQDYGFWMNQMPFAFLIPGFIQKAFGIGIETGRIFSVIMAVLALLGLWFLGYRFRGRWGGAFAVLVIVLNPFSAQYYSLAVTQATLAFLLVLTMIFGLGKDRKLWETSLASIIAALILLMRINLAPVLILLILFIFWQNGTKAGKIALCTGLITVLLGHLLFWPNILRTWVYWLPESLRFLFENFSPPVGTPVWAIDGSWFSRVISIFQSFRYQFFILTGFIVSLFLWPPRKAWKKEEDYQISVFLAVLFGILLLIHAWATLGRNYCVFCFSPYIAFFSILSVLLVLISFPYWRRKVSVWLALAICLVVITISTGIGFAAFEDYGNFLAEKVEDTRVSLLPNKDSFSQVSKFVLVQITDLPSQTQRRILPLAAGLIIGSLIILASIIIWIVGKTTRKINLPSLGSITLVLFLVIGATLMPTPWLGDNHQNSQCEEDVIERYRVIGKELDQIIPEGSKVYWKGYSSLPLLYIPGIKIYPPQVNGIYTFFYDGNSDQLERYGFWNRELDKQWLEEADFILIDERIFLKEPLYKEFRNGFSPTDKVEIYRTLPMEPCLNNSSVIVYQSRNQE